MMCISGKSAAASLNRAFNGIDRLGGHQNRSNLQAISSFHSLPCQVWQFSQCRNNYCQDDSAIFSIMDVFGYKLCFCMHQLQLEDFDICTSDTIGMEGVVCKSQTRILQFLITKLEYSNDFAEYLKTKGLVLLIFY